jgi:ComF family protein
MIFSKWLFARALAATDLAWTRTIEAAFPITCLHCGTNRKEEFPTAEREHPSISICGSCRSLLAPEILHSCRKCGAETGPFSQTTSGCIHCRKRSLKFTSCICLGMYQGPLKRFMLSSKWSWSSIRVQALAALLWQERQTSISGFNFDTLIPIPQHWSRRLVRHFNPAWVIAETLSCRMQKSGINIACDPHILRRSRSVGLQKRVSLRQRQENQRSSFDVTDVSRIQNRRVLLVDDVLTTGATCSEAARTLISAGAADCHVAVVGRVLTHTISRPAGFVADGGSEKHSQL